MYQCTVNNDERRLHLHNTFPMSSLLLALPEYVCLEILNSCLDVKDCSFLDTGYDFEGKWSTPLNYLEWIEMKNIKISRLIILCRDLFSENGLKISIVTSKLRELSLCDTSFRTKISGFVQFVNSCPHLKRMAMERVDGFADKAVFSMHSNIWKNLTKFHYVGDECILEISPGGLRYLASICHSLTDIMLHWCCDNENSYDEVVLEVLRSNQNLQIIEMSKVAHMEGILNQIGESCPIIHTDNLFLHCDPNCIGKFVSARRNSLKSISLGSELLIDDGVPIIKFDRNVNVNGEEYIAVHLLQMCACELNALNHENWMKTIHELSLEEVQSYDEDNVLCDVHIINLVCNNSNLVSLRIGCTAWGGQYTVQPFVQILLTCINLRSFTLDVSYLVCEDEKCLLTAEDMIVLFVDTPHQLTYLDITCCDTLDWETVRAILEHNTSIQSVGKFCGCELLPRKTVEEIQVWLKDTRFDC